MRVIALDFELNVWNHAGMRRDVLAWVFAFQCFCCYVSVGGYLDCGAFCHFSRVAGAYLVMCSRDVTAEVRRY
jgi:hypothetical protein